MLLFMIVHKIISFFFQLVSELRTYLKGKGAEIPEESNNEGDIVKDIAEILNTTAVMFQADITAEGKGA